MTYRLKELPLTSHVKCEAVARGALSVVSSAGVLALILPENQSSSQLEQVCLPGQADDAKDGQVLGAVRPHEQALGLLQGQAVLQLAVACTQTNRLLALLGIRTIKKSGSFDY